MASPQVEDGRTQDAARKTRRSTNFGALWHKMRQLRQHRDAESTRFDELRHAVSQMTRYEGAPGFCGAEVGPRRQRSRRKRGGARVRQAKRLRAAHEGKAGVEPQGEASLCPQKTVISGGRVASGAIGSRRRSRASDSLQQVSGWQDQRAGGRAAVPQDTYGRQGIWPCR